MHPAGHLEINLQSLLIIFDYLFSVHHCFIFLFCIPYIELETSVLIFTSLFFLFLIFA